MSYQLTEIPKHLIELNQELIPIDKPHKKARAKSPISTMKFRSKTEERAWYEWVLMQGAVRCLYEPLVFHLQGGNYTPDFVLVFEDGSMWFVECKGSWSAYQSGRSSKRNLKQAAVEFGWMGDWMALLPDKKQWKVEKF